MLADRLGKAEGVSFCLPETVAHDATAVCGHLLLTEHNKAAASVSVLYDGGATAHGYVAATNAYSYTALDEAAIRALLSQYSNVEGDPYSVLSDDRTVLVSAWRSFARWP